MVKFSARAVAVAFIATAITSVIAFCPVHKAEARITNKSVVVAPAYQELIVQIPSLNDKNYLDIAQSFVANGGVEFKGYCKTFSLLMFVVDRSAQPTNDFVEQTMHAKELTYDIKADATIEQMNAECGLDIPANQNPH
jgi:hypothetical protein